ncbi:TIGR02710 family CRISPR-associated CARF protein [Methylomarinum sp. Ch1-1]|uniref:TIGR02710 family CRISPR-associated CARF protein n=1 Tax=Methylomarinum roseum TaxID=3067653 RepID=A0AAU7NQV1_9GAMM|nr:TIGR02710 family CRISPR-associated CARF protein [Methylomarinum sp. Ch1-1]MDP4521010.1 TIGR02710 family CRISPR-associated CARF protein [Methylomarinum sp. Ch1-1]
MNSKPIILVCTVGGSHQPIVSAINEMRPDYVVFICTDKDPATGRPGSNIQITGKGHCIKAHNNDDKPTLPAIPQQTGLSQEAYEVVLTVSDDLDRIYLDCSRVIDSVLKKFPGAGIVADYTGGTKSMSAGLAMAALENPNIELQLVTGNRSDLIKVHDGSQYTALANIEQIRFQRTLAPFRACWERFAYGEAEAGLKRIQTPRNTQLRAALNRFRDLSTAFAEWDNFNHEIALRILRPYAPSMPSTMKPYLGIAMRLNDNDPKKRDAARLYDLYLNALRRAEQGRFDDAIARIYRLIEWTAQWMLLHRCGIDTANVPETEIPDGMQLSLNREQQWQAGLYNAWQLIKLKTDGAAAQFIEQEDKTLLNHIKIRNQSILAHGFSPVRREHWHELVRFIEHKFIPMLLAETACVGIKTLPNQLPNRYELN